MSRRRAPGRPRDGAGAPAGGQGARDAAFMRRALDLAARGLGETNPNPAVGCVIVRDGRVVGEGYHRRAGEPHAEAAALRRAGRRARGATAYLNLEPCAHQGRTGPCAPLLVEAGIRRVVAAMRDPNPLVLGRGLRRLRRAGVKVETGLLEPEARLLNEPFAVSVRARRPFVLLKAALTIDGRIATAAGESKWITSAAQRRAARALRRRYDGVAVGIGTVLADDPLLLPSPRVHRPFHRIVFDSRLRLPLTSRLVRTARSAPVWVLTRGGDRRKRARLERLGVVVIEVPGRGRVPAAAALRELYARGLRSVMIEGGSELLGSFVAEGLFDRLALFRAPLLVGGRRALPAFGGPDRARLADAPRLRAGPPLAGAETWYPAR
jgi:diaminohydroxyphosphoribosylaminopyrimidine deaminase/5-amino-6-(5-phosphoribosylamino)uracil reductase